MTLSLARFTLQTHIFKKADALGLRERLRYLVMARRVHGVVLGFWALFALFLVFIGLWAFFPHLGVILHLDEPGHEISRDYWASGAFFCLAILLVIGCRVMMCTREILGSLFIVNFAAYVGSLTRNT